MSRSWLWVVPALLFSSTSYAKQKGNNEYQTSSLFKSGYKEKRLAVNEWMISTQSKERNRDKALVLALYRAALLANADGYKYIEVIDGEIGILTMYTTVILQNYAKIDVVATKTPSDVLSCKAHKIFRYLCHQYGVEKLILEMQDFLERTPEQRASDLQVTAR